MFKRPKCNVPSRRLHAQMERLETTVRQKAIKRGRDGANAILNETQLRVQVFAIRADNSHDNIRVSTNVPANMVVGSK